MSYYYLNGGGERARAKGTDARLLRVEGGLTGRVLRAGMEDGVLREKQKNKNK